MVTRENSISPYHLEESAGALSAAHSNRGPFSWGGTRGTFAATFLDPGPMGGPLGKFTKKSQKSCLGYRDPDPGVRTRLSKDGVRSSLTAVLSDGQRF